MDYLKVHWHHDYQAEPVILLSELDDERYEIRKVEVFADGHRGFASRDCSSGGTQLGEIPIPPLSEIAADPQFIIEKLDAQRFEEAWHSATTA